MTITTRKIQGAAVEAGGTTVGRVDDVFVDVRTGDVTHVSVALTGWYRGNVVLVPVDPCGFCYKNRRLHLQGFTAEGVRQAPPLDDESILNADTAVLLAMYQDTAPCWPFHCRCCATATRSESIEGKTGQPALWASRDLAGATASCGTGSALGRVEGLDLDVETWRVTGVRVRQGHWYRHRSLPVSMADVLEVVRNGDDTTMLLNPAVARWAA